MRVIPPPSRRRAAVIFLLLIASVSAPRPRAAAGDVLPFKATERTLANGLKVIVVPTGFPNLVSIQIPVQTGSRNEVEPGKSGFAHFFEHLMFRGTPNTPPREVPRDHDARPARATTPAPATTRTHYYATFAKEHLETIRRALRRHVPAPGLLGSRLQDRGARDSRRIQQEQRRPVREALRGAARPLLPGAHLQAHDDGLHRRHREHAERVRSTRSCSSSAGTARSTRPSSSPAT